MKFNEKLQVLRKEMKLSQEQLADKLNVSRQAVSKWESGGAYPEMDKLIAMCKLFRCTIDDLTNDEVKEIGTTYSSKNNLNNIVDEILYMITKSVNMITSMNTKQFLSMLFGMFVTLIIIAILKIPINILYNMGDNVLNYFNSGFSMFLSKVWYFILNAGYLILAILLFFYIYKVKYLDNYEEIKKEIIIETKLENKETKQEKIIVTKQPSSEKRYAFFSILGTIFSLIVKFCIICFALPFMITLFIFFAIFIIELGFALNGIVFFGIIIGTLALISLNIMIIYLTVHALFEKKVNTKYILLNLVIAISSIGIATGITFFEVGNYKIIEGNINLQTDIIENTFEMKEDTKLGWHLYENYYDQVKFVEDASMNDSIKITVVYPYEYNSVSINEDPSNFIIVNIWEKPNIIYTVINQVIEDLKHKKIYNYNLNSVTEYTITTSKENYDKIIKNTEEYWEDERQEDMYYQSRINELQDQIDTLYQNQETLEEEKSNLEDKISEYEDKINEYKEKLEEIKNTLNYQIDY